MAGRKQKPCEWCEQEQFTQTDYDARNVSVALEIYPDNCIMAILIQGKSDDGELTYDENWDVPMNFCPNCGRRLGY